MSEDLALGPWPAGLDNKTREGSSPKTLREAVNVLVSSEGIVSTRPGVVRGYQDATLHSLWSGTAGAYCVRGTMLCAVQVNGTTVTLEELYDLGSASPVYYEEVNGVVYASSFNTLVEIMHNEVALLGPPDGRFRYSMVDGGALEAGRYAVAVTYKDKYGREGGSSQVVVLDVAEGKGIALSLDYPMSAESAVVYMSANNSETLRSVTETTDSTVLLGPGMPTGNVLQTRFLTWMPPGEHIAYWRGRLLVARGRTVYFSEPLQYHLSSRIKNWVQLPKPVTMLATVESTVAVGQDDGVALFQGDSPANWVQRRMLASVPVPGSNAYLSGAEMNQELGIGSSRVAVWLGDRCYTVMLPDGNILEPQADRLSIPALLSGRTLIKDFRMTTVVR